MNIKEIRFKLGLTQQECADYLNISRRTYQYLEKDNADNGSSKYIFYCKQLENYKKEPGLLFNTSIVIGDKLQLFIDLVKKYKKRFCYKSLLSYLNSNVDKVCILYGLRRTGKTTMLFQALKDIDFNKAAYIKVKESDNMLIKDINILNENGYKYLFIDEVTLMEDFINSAATLSDIYCKLGMKIVLSGTDSLGFAFADKDELYDRNIMVHTSYISFKEFSYILGIDDVDQYIEYGGTFKIENMNYDDIDSKNDEVAFRSDESTRKYIDTAISRNIQRSLRNNHFGSSFASLKELYDNNELTNAINRIIDNMNHDFLIKVITNKYKSTDLGSSKQLLLHNQNPNVQTALYDINEEKMINKMKDILDIKEKEELVSNINNEAIYQIKTYLMMLDLIKEIEVRYEDGHIEKRTIFTQPGMRYAITKSLVYSLLSDNYFISLSESDKNIIIEKILSDVKGRMLEDIVLLETLLSLDSNHKVFKYISYQYGEIDMVIYNNDSFDVYEIKHSGQIAYDSQTKYLNNSNIIELLKNKYGTLKNKYVLYNGENYQKEGIHYVNVVEYLKSL